MPCLTGPPPGSHGSGVVARWWEVAVAGLLGLALGGAACGGAGHFVASKITSLRTKHSAKAPVGGAGGWGEGQRDGASYEVSVEQCWRSDQLDNINELSWGGMFFACIMSYVRLPAGEWVQPGDSSWWHRVQLPVHVARACCNRSWFLSCFV